MDFKQFAEKLAPAFPNAKFITAVPVRDIADNGVYEIGVWTAEASDAFKSKKDFDDYLGWGAMPGNITYFCLTDNDISFESYGSVSDINWSDVIFEL